MSLNIENHQGSLNTNVNNTSQSHHSQVICRNRFNFLSIKKCWICLADLALDANEQLTIQNYFIEKNLYLWSTCNFNNNNKIQSNFIQLKLFMNKFVLSVCKCRKKLSHLNCFNNYIDMKQNGDVNIEILCSKCNFKYEFEYPYNSYFLKFFDWIEIISSKFASIASGLLCLVSSYWCCLSYGVITVLQIYGYDQGLSLLTNSNKFILSILLPLIPTVLIACRFVSWQDYFINLFPDYFNQKSSLQTQKQTQVRGDEEDEKDDAKFLATIRQVVGGLLLPSIAVVIDKLVISHIVPCSAFFRTFVAGLAYTGIKGLVKIFLVHKKNWQQANRDIQNYK